MGDYCVAVAGVLQRCQSDGQSDKNIQVINLSPANPIKDLAEPPALFPAEYKQKTQQTDTTSTQSSMIPHSALCKKVTVQTHPISSANNNINPKARVNFSVYYSLYQ